MTNLRSFLLLHSEITEYNLAPLKKVPLEQQRKKEL